TRESWSKPMIIAAYHVQESPDAIRLRSEAFELKAGEAPSCAHRGTGLRPAAQPCGKKAVEAGKSGFRPHQMERQRPEVALLSQPVSLDPAFAGRDGLAGEISVLGQKLRHLLRPLLRLERARAVEDDPAGLY